MTHSLNDAAPVITKATSVTDHTIMVDIIIPVDQGLPETKACLESVLACSQNTPVEIIVINDCSTNAAINAYLDELARKNQITLFQSPYTLGFVNCANRGMALHPDRDVVLLKNDTEVHGDWLDRLARCAYSHSSIATVTPFSNHAAVCSYPCIAKNNTLTADSSLQELDDLFSALNSNQSIEIPAAMEFCTYIRRTCLNQTGYFDAAIFESGDQAAIDFSMRSFDCGFSHLLCADVFVAHRGNLLLDNKPDDLHNQSQQTRIKERYPHYSTLIADFYARDAARIFRRRIDIARLIRSSRRKILFITHTMGGGTEKHVQDLSKLLESECEIFILRPTDKEQINIQWARSGEEFIIYFQLPYHYSNLLNLINNLDISYIHFHHVIGLNQQILQLPNDLDLPYDFTLHDYYPICPQYTLTFEDGNYCGEPDTIGCNRCLSQRPALWGMDILSWRTLFNSVFIGAERVIAPSSDTLERMKTYIPNANYMYLPHPESPSASSQTTVTRTGNRMKVLVIGRLSLVKGLKLLEQCAIDASIRQLPLHFRVIGFPVEEVKTYPDIPLSFYGPYDDDQLSTLIEFERADVIFFPALWPETYSYTLSYAINSRLPIVAPRLGAFTERLNAYPLGWLMDYGSDAAAYNDLFVSLLNKTLHFDPGWNNQMLSQESFLRRYLEGLPPLKSLISNKKPKIKFNFNLENHYYQHHNSLEFCIDTLSRSQLIEIIKKIADPDQCAPLTPAQLTAHVEGLRSQIKRQQEQQQQQQDYQKQQEDKIANLEEQLLYSKAENVEQRAELDKLSNSISQHNSDMQQLNHELHRIQQQIAELLTASRDNESSKPKVSEIVKTIYRTGWLFFPIRVIRAAIFGDKRYLFEVAIRCRSKINGFRINLREKRPSVSYFIVEPPFIVMRWVFKSFIRRFFYAFFNEMVYELHKKTAFSKDGFANNQSEALPNFIVSQHFEQIGFSFSPTVTVIVPNYNHGKFLERRLDSIYQQTYRHFNVILLDDSSADNSREILLHYAELYPEMTQINFNSKNSGSVFMQWKKGLDLADGDLIWIAESDDFCDQDFLEKLVPFFMDEAIQLAYARSVFVGPDNQPAAFAFDDYLTDLGAEKWASDYVESAHTEVARALGRKNTIPNVSSALFRKPADLSLFNDQSWLKMKICGDWIFYLHLLRGAKIAFSNSTRNYYRFHSANSSVSTYNKLAYYQEHESVAKTIIQLYKTPDATLYANHELIEKFWDQNMKEFDKSAFVASYDIGNVLKLKSARLPNIMMAAYSFSTGGGEIFPIRLANQLKKKGYGITFFNFNREPLNANVRKMLASDIPVCEYNQKTGCLDQLLDDFGIEIIHTHHASTEHFFATYMKKTKGKVKHVVTMHGMYETLEKVHIDNNLPVIMNNVDLWVYIADKNIELFKAKNYFSREKFIKIGNGMEPPVIHSLDRRDLNIPEDAFILCQASRAMPEKGWEEAIEIVTEARNLSGRDIHLLLLGDGPVYNALLLRELPDYIHLLGFRNNPVDYYAMADMGFLASRFRGESFPLSIIECLFSGNPFIASDIGEIRNMLTTHEGMAGAVFELDDWKIPVNKVAQIVAEFAANPDRYQQARALAERAAQPFCMDNIIADYEKAYQQVLLSSPAIAIL